jgi:acetyl-CoA synthetase
MADDTHKEIYPPSQDILKNAIIKNPDELAQMAEQDLAGFWEKQAREFEWFSPWTKVLDDSAKPFYKWFVGARTNIVYNCLDRHVNTWRRNKLALIWEGEKGESRTFSYHALNREVCMFANVLQVH